MRKPKPTGRPSSFTQGKADAICERLAEGESLRSICADEEMPAKATVFKWLSDRDAFADQYARAREAQADALFDEILEIADDGRNDLMEKFDADGQSAGWRENGEVIRRSVLRVDARKWMAGKLRPKKYGERAQMELSGPDGGPIEHAIDVQAMTDNQLWALLFEENPDLKARAGHVVNNNRQNTEGDA